MRASGSPLRLLLAALAVASGCALGSNGRDELAAAWSAGRSNVEVEDHGIVRRVLGTRVTRGGAHEGFLVDVPGNGGRSITILIEDNVDLTGPIPVTRGDAVRFRGVYVYNQRGGLVHWTHRDPRLRHISGYIEVNGRLYQ
jgi:hypothetical protein